MMYKYADKGQDITDENYILYYLFYLYLYMLVGRVRKLDHILPGAVAAFHFFPSSFNMPFP